MPLIPLIIALIVAAGAGTVVTADVSKPGDVLYGLDQFMENFQEKMPMSQSNRVNFLDRLSKERAKELVDLQEVDSEELDKKAKEHLEELKESATTRLATSVEKLELIQEELGIEADVIDTEEAQDALDNSNNSVVPPIIDNYDYTLPIAPIIPSIPLPPISFPYFDFPQEEPINEPGDNNASEDTPWNQGPSD